jgi:hypothetical protein
MNSAKGKTERVPAIGDRLLTLREAAEVLRLNPVLCANTCTAERSRAGLLIRLYHFHQTDGMYLRSSHPIEDEISYPRSCIRYHETGGESVSCLSAL